MPTIYKILESTWKTTGSACKYIKVKDENLSSRETHNFWTYNLFGFGKLTEELLVVFVTARSARKRR